MAKKKAKTKRKVVKKRVAKKRAPARKKNAKKKTGGKKKRRSRKATGQTSRRLIIAALDHYGKVSYYDGVKYTNVRANAAEFGSLEAAQRVAKQLAKLSMMRMTGVFLSTDSEESIRRDFGSKM